MMSTINAGNTEKLNRLRRNLGWIWMIAGPAAIIALVRGAVLNIDAGLPGDIHQLLPWIIIIAIFTPIAVALTIFGWYCRSGEYDLETGPANEAR